MSNFGRKFKKSHLESLTWEIWIMNNKQESEDLEQRFDKLEESVHQNYRLVLAIGVGIMAGCFAFVLGLSLKESAWAVLIGGLCVEIESIYEARRQNK